MSFIPPLTGIQRQFDDPYPLVVRTNTAIRKPRPRLTVNEPIRLATIREERMWRLFEQMAAAIPSKTESISRSPSSSKLSEYSDSASEKSD
jgi:hypothetical protein